MSVVNEIISEAIQKGYDAEIVELYARDIRGCRGCGSCHSGKVEFCVQNDDMQPLYRKLVEADAIVFASPVYFGHITGPAKTFLDRWCTFFDNQFTPRHLPGKKLITVLTCGAPAETYDSLKKFWADLAGFFKMNLAINLIFGDCMDGNTAAGNSKYLQAAREAAQSI
jgi:multimeric flavodoxin WrbA